MMLMGKKNQLTMAIENLASKVDALPEELNSGLPTQEISDTLQRVKELAAEIKSKEEQAKAERKEDEAETEKNFDNLGGAADEMTRKQQKSTDMSIARLMERPTAEQPRDHA